MPTQRQIEKFTLAFHRRAVERLRQRPELIRDAMAVLDRWESIASQSGRSYRDEWREILKLGVPAVESAACVDTEHAATLRSTSPLGFVLDPDERLSLRRETMAA